MENDVANVVVIKAKVEAEVENCLIGASCVLVKLNAEDAAARAALLDNSCHFRSCYAVVVVWRVDAVARRAKIGAAPSSLSLMSLRSLSAAVVLLLLQCRRECCCCLVDAEVDVAVVLLLL